MVGERLDRSCDTYSVLWSPTDVIAREDYQVVTRDIPRMNLSPWHLDRHMPLHSNPYVVEPPLRGPVGDLAENEIANEREPQDDEGATHDHPDAERSEYRGSRCHADDE